MEMCNKVVTNIYGKFDHLVSAFPERSLFLWYRSKRCASICCEKNLAIMAFEILMQNALPKSYHTSRAELADFVCKSKSKPAHLWKPIQNACPSADITKFMSSVSNLLLLSCDLWYNVKQDPMCDHKFADIWYGNFNRSHWCQTLSHSIWVNFNDMHAYLFDPILFKHAVDASGTFQADLNNYATQCVGVSTKHTTKMKVNPCPMKYGHDLQNIANKVKVIMLKMLNFLKIFSNNLNQVTMPLFPSSLELVYYIMVYSLNLPVINDLLDFV
jgi:hypothetical protein